ncbi:hypothetical protein MVEN_01693100 [Mycena venus]|uniref:Uncharacterized protein n=1 Tax=Mycena venus TaxID=2733690 RepID=A0A8H7CQ08_9AGAR|nr:hypothetical protein MVEN_01693100 [Mycena venus]
MASILQTAVPPSDSPEAALARAFPYLKASTTLFLRTVIVCVALVGSIVLHPLFIVFLSPLPVLARILLYILSPLHLFVKIFLDIVLYTPYRTIAYLSDVFYPAYVFFGVACVTGMMLGLVGRFVVLGVVDAVEFPPAPPVILVDADALERKPLRIS